MNIKEINRTLIIFSVLFFSLSCSSLNKLPKTFKLYEGSWRLENANTIESWQYIGDQLVGSVIKIENKDTLVVENLRIVQKKENIYFEATVPSQNRGKTIQFKLTENSKNQFQFENPDHDFPQKIIYNFTDEKSFTATISAPGKQATFNYRKISHK